MEGISQGTGEDLAERKRQKARDNSRRWYETKGRALRGHVRQSERVYPRGTASDEEIRERNRIYWRTYYAKKTGRTVDELKSKPRLTEAQRKESEYNGRARERRRDEGLIGEHFYCDVLWLYDQQRGECANCSAALSDRYHVDHFVPVSLGGSDWPHNLQLLCPGCNCGKSNKDPLEWRYGDDLKGLIKEALDANK